MHITGEMALSQATDWAQNREVYIMGIEHAHDMVELVSTVVERFGIQINTFMATC